MVAADDPSIHTSLYLVMSGSPLIVVWAAASRALSASAVLVDGPCNLPLSPMVGDAKVAAKSAAKGYAIHKAQTREVLESWLRRN